MGTFRSLLQFLLIVILGTTGYAQMTNPQSPMQRLEAKAQLAKADAPNTIEDLSHEVMVSPHLYRFPPSVSDVLEHNLSRAELAYRNHTGPGVSEAQLLTIAGILEKEFHVPTYARTTAAQIRTLRILMVLNNPSFMGAGIMSPGAKVGDSIQPILSPLQAFHLLRVLIDQKVVNPDFQDPSLDIAALHQQRLNQSINQTAPATGSPRSISVRTNPHSAEMRSVISSHAQAMSVEDGYSLANQIIEALGMK
jgi:hypothetical protein